jgi:hypothetical protein
MKKVITEFRCKICNKDYASYQSLWIHNKKFHNNHITDSNGNITDSNGNITDSNGNITINKLICKYCKKIFKHVQNRHEHEKKVCEKKLTKIKINEIKNTELKTNSLQTINNTNNNNNNNTNNITNTNTNINNTNSNNIINTKIIINKLGDENVLHLTKEEVMIIFNKELESLTTMIEYLNFNERLPENHSFCTTNLESGFLSVYNTDKQTVEKDRKKYMFDKILDNSIDKIQLLYNHYKNKFDSKRRKQIEDNLDNMRQIKIAFMNNRIKKEVFKKINLISYNNKDVIKKTWEGKRHKLRPELTFEEDLERPLTDSEEETSEEESDIDSSDHIVITKVKN